MSIEEFKRKLEALCGEQSIDILLFLRDRGWCIAYDIAKNLHLHPTTVSRYLSKMHRAGIISKRPKKSRTGATFEYKLKALEIALSLDLSREETYSANISPTINLILKIVERLEKIGNPPKLEIFKDKRERKIIDLILSGKVQEAEESAREDSDALFKALKKLIEFSEKSLGKAMTRDIVLSTGNSMPASMIDFMPDYVQEVVT